MTQAPCLSLPKGYMAVLLPQGMSLIHLFDEIGWCDFEVKGQKILNTKRETVCSGCSWASRHHRTPNSSRQNKTGWLNRWSRKHTFFWEKQSSAEWNCSSDGENQERRQQRPSSQNLAIGKKIKLRKKSSLGDVVAVKKHIFGRRKKASNVDQKNQNSSKISQKPPKRSKSTAP